MSALTAATARRDWLEPVLEVVAHLDMALGHARQSAGAADRTVTDLRRAELNGGELTGKPAKQIARELKGPLDVLLDAPHAQVASAEVTRALLAIPRQQLLAPAVERGLGRARFALLRRHIENECGAQDGTPGAATNGVQARGTLEG